MAGNGGDAPRLDRVERIIAASAARRADIEDEFRRLLRAQVVMADTMRELAAEHLKLAQARRRREEAQRRTIPPPL